MNYLFMLLAMLLVFPMANAQDGNGNQCSPVNATANFTDYLEGPENCDGFDYCIPGRLTGTLNG